MAVLTIAFLLHAASAVNPPPAVCCEGEAASVTWVVNGSSPGMWCFQMLYSAENYMGCAALRSCERNGHEIWLTCPDGYETDSGTPLRLKRSVSRGDLNYLTMLSGLLQHIIGEWQPQGGNNGKYQWNTIFYLPIHQFYRTCAWGAGRNPDVWWCYPPFSWMFCSCFLSSRLPADVPISLQGLCGRLCASSNTLQGGRGVHSRKSCLRDSYGSFNLAHWYCSIAQ